MLIKNGANANWHQQELEVKQWNGPSVEQILLISSTTYFFFFFSRTQNWSHDPSLEILLNEYNLPNSYPTHTHTHFQKSISDLTSFSALHIKEETCILGLDDTLPIHVNSKLLVMPA